MKVRDLNNSSRKTKRLIKKVFAEMLSEKKELGRISVSELCKRADISRGAFYSHYDDIYGVAADYENEMIDTFFDSARLVASSDIMKFIDSIFEFIRQNNENYRLLCRSNEFLFAAKKLTAIASGKLLELCRSDDRIKKHGAHRDRAVDISRGALVRICKILQRLFGQNARRALRIHKILGEKFHRAPLGGVKTDSPQKIL